MAFIHHIQVTFDPANKTLTPDETQINLQAEDAVRWVFPGDIPPHLLPHIVFLPRDDDDTEDNALFGPFQYLEPSSSGVFAIGNTGVLGEHPYRILLLSEEDPIASSQVSASINNLSDQSNTSPFALVRFTPDDPASLTPDPETLFLEVGRTAVWYFTGIPSDKFVTFHFEGFPDPMTGPFASFSLSQGFGNNDWLVNGAGFLSDFPDHPLDQITYFLHLRESSGKILQTADPVIEPLGTPPGGTLEEE